MEQERESENKDWMENPAAAPEDLADFTGNMLTSLFDDELLNTSYQKLEACGEGSDGPVREILDELASGLNERLLDSSDPEWTSYVQLCMLHPLRKLLHEDPFTRLAHQKPRGYPGDPGLLDFVYGAEPGHGPPEGTSPLGRQIFAYTTHRSVCDGVRAQARQIARAVDQLAAMSSRPEVLAVGAGHLREAGYSAALENRQVGRWIAFDSDADSLKEVRRCYGERGVETAAGTIRQIVAGKSELGAFDLIYCTGIYNYLEQLVGQRLTAKLFELLRPGGRLLIAGFLTGVPERGYMESFMDWRLVYRFPEQLLDLAAGIDPDAVADVRLSAADPEANRHATLLQIEKA